VDIVWWGVKGEERVGGRKKRKKKKKLNSYANNRNKCVWK
jgi:hypothetical protein